MFTNPAQAVPSRGSSFWRSTASRPIALSGFMGAGKTTMGQRLARTLGWPFVDLDAEIESAFARPVRAVFAEEGEEIFRAMEARLLHQALSLPERVVALGGGTALHPPNRDLLLERATWVHLRVSAREAARRLRGDSTRPLLDDPTVLATLHLERAAACVDAPFQVDAEGRPEDVARSLLASLAAPLEVHVPRSPALPPHRLQVQVPGKRYEVVVGRDLFDFLAASVATIGAGPVAVVTDWEVGPRFADTLRAAIEALGRPVVTLTMPSGEANKQIGPVLEAVDRLLDAGWQRSSPVVALGGGVLGDMAGLLASLVLRGVPLVQVPTTLLAMVDSSVGGKVGVNHRRGKNLIGAFHQPDLVVSDLRFLDALPDRELRAGLAEVVKTALLGDPELLAALERDPSRYLERDGDALFDAVARCVRFKASVVASDERDLDRRAILNLGHTVAHGLEVACGYGALRHGEAVSIGLVAAAEVGARSGVGDPALPRRVRAILSHLGLPIRSPPVSLSALEDAIKGDKKLKGDALLWILMDKSSVPRLVSSPVGELADRLSDLVEAGVLTRGGDGP